MPILTSPTKLGEAALRAAGGDRERAAGILLLEAFNINDRAPMGGPDPRLLVNRRKKAAKIVLARRGDSMTEDKMKERDAAMQADIDTFRQRYPRADEGTEPRQRDVEGRCACAERVVGGGITARPRRDGRQRVLSPLDPQLESGRLRPAGALIGESGRKRVNSPKG